MASEKEQVALVSIAASGTMAAVKFGVGLWIGSLALIADALHSLVDLGATIVTYFAVRFGDRPADHDHPYGHGKFESIAALAETMLLFALAGAVAVEAVQRLIDGGSPVILSWIPFAVLAVEMGVNGWRAMELRRVARKTGSQALEADALHFFTDLLGSIAVMIGLGLAGLGYLWGDAAGALVVALIVIGLGIKLGTRTLATLTDTAPRGQADAVRAAVSQVRGIVAIDRLRLRPVGPTTFVDLGIGVPRALPLDRVAAIKTQATNAIRAALGDADVAIESRPMALDDETVTERVLIIARNRGLAIHHVTVHHIGDRLAIALDLEVDGTLPLGRAHDIASDLEEAVKAELGADVEVETHIEPLQAEALGGVDADPARIDAVRVALMAANLDGGPISDIHNIRVRSTPAGDIVNFHCRVDPRLPVGVVHHAVDDLERGLKRAMPGLNRVIGHAEPVRS